ncbi:M15 family metallopeptidase, partial [Yersinia ruckeri]
YEQIAAAFKQAAKDVGVPIEWGGDWKTLKDGPHFQLPHKDYPA